MKTKIACLALICAGLMLGSCTKQGPAGPAGAAGTNGTNGNANVQETTFYAKQFTYNTANSDYEINLNVNGISNTWELDHAAVMVYFRASGSGWIQLPCIAGSVQFNVINYVGYVNVNCNTNVSANYYDFKVVVIPQ